MVLRVSEVVWSSHWAAAATGQRVVCDCGCAVWWNVVGISLFEVCWWLHQTGVKKNSKKKKNPTKKQKQKHTQKNCILLFQTLLFLIIKLENCVFFILVSSLHSLVSSFYFQGKICFEFFNFFLTRKGRAMGWGGHKGHRPQNEAVTPCPALGPTNQLPFP